MKSKTTFDHYVQLIMMTAMQCYNTSAINPRDLLGLHLNNKHNHCH